jgi:hypothetical protein
MVKICFFSVKTRSSYKEIVSPWILETYFLTVFFFVPDDRGLFCFSCSSRYLFPIYLHPFEKSVKYVRLVAGLHFLSEGNLCVLILVL